ncbi:MAG: hypothetical protein KF862_10375 [Chitinophagaceae bacterium]|nr:hypothetical protein [Chitinophagaceae bacterium]
MKRYFLILWLILRLTNFSCSQKATENICNARIDSLYKVYQRHLILFCYYNPTINVRADTVYDYLPYYRTSDIDSADVIEKNKQVVKNLAEFVCTVDSSKINYIENWCIASISMENTIKGIEFTLDEYMEFLSKNEKMKFLITSYLTNSRTVSSLSTSEMENIFFTSIESISHMPYPEQQKFYRNITFYFNNIHSDASP